ncbi:MAG: helicase HerA domain-containing protein [Candidatus Hodarchaeales archaeon]
MRIEIFGQSGTGKSHAAKALLEEFVNWRIPFVVIDPEGEYLSFKEITKVLIIGGGYSDLPLEPTIYSKLFDFLFKENINLIFDLSEQIGFEERAKVSTRIQEELFNAATKYRRLFVYLVDETKLIAPQAFRTKSNAIASDIAQRGRKRGFIPIFVMQRPSEVDKGVLTQCNIHLMGRLQFPTDLKYIKQLLDDAKIAEEDIKKLSQEFYLWTGEEAKKIRFRPLKIKDLGKTVQPGSSLSLSFKSDTSLERIVKALKESLIHLQENEQKEKNQIEILKQQMKEQEDKISKLRKELELERQAKKVAKKIDFKVESPLENQQYQTEIEDLRGKMKILQESINVLGRFEGNNKGIINLELNKIENLFPLDILGVDMRTGAIIGGENSNLLLEQLNPTERKLFFAMQHKGDLSKTKIWGLIQGKGKRTLDPAIRNLEKIGLAKRIRKGKITFYQAIQVEELFEK